MTPDGFATRLESLSKSLDSAQFASRTLEDRWSTLRPEDVPQTSVSDWWSVARADPSSASEKLQSLMRLFDMCATTMREAEVILKPWVIRHLRHRTFEGASTRRREVPPGAAILGNGSGSEGRTIAITGAFSIGAM